MNIAAADIDQLAATLQHKVSRGKIYLTKGTATSSVAAALPFARQELLILQALQPHRNQFRQQLFPRKGS